MKITDMVVQNVSVYICIAKVCIQYRSIIILIWPLICVTLFWDCSGAMVTLIRTKQKNVMFHLQNVGNMVAFKLEYRQYYKHTQLDSPQHSINRWTGVMCSLHIGIIMFIITLLCQNINIITIVI